jgi:hypothetical protein
LCIKSASQAGRFLQKSTVVRILISFLKSPCQEPLLPHLPEVHRHGAVPKGRLQRAGVFTGARVFARDEKKPNLTKNPGNRNQGTMAVFASSGQIKSSARKRKNPCQSGQVAKPG